MLASYNGGYGKRLDDRMITKNEDYKNDTSEYIVAGS